MSESLLPPAPGMTAQQFVARFEGLKRRLPGAGLVREEAAQVLRLQGLPTVHDEDWRYTSLRALEAIRFDTSLTLVGEAGDATAALAALGLPDGPRLVFVDGRFTPALSVLPDFVRTTSFGQEPRFGPLAKPERGQLVALNTMLAEDGAAMTVDQGVDGGTLLLVSIGAHSEHRTIAFHPRHAVTLERGARLTLIEVSAGAGAYLHNPVFEITVSPGATLTHVRLQDEAMEAVHLSTAYVEIGEGAVYDSFSLNLGGALTRTEIHASLLGERSTVHLNGAQLLTGRQHADFTTAVAHVAPNCASRQTVKNVLAGHSRGVFQGRIDVAREAQKTDGYQMNQALLLSEHAEIDSKPQLRIHADDVKCSHGATVGELDHEHVFYLRSRGIPEAEARAILVRAFLAEAIDGIVHEEARALLDRALDRWWLRNGMGFAA